MASHRESDASNITVYASMADQSSTGQADAEDAGNRPRFIRTIRGAFCERKRLSLDHNLSVIRPVLKKEEFKLLHPPCDAYRDRGTSHSFHSTDF